MAIVPYQILVTPYDGTSVIVLWEGLMADDTGQPFFGGHRPQKTLHIFGTFGGGTVTIQGSMELTPVTWIVLRHTEAANFTATVALLRTVADNPLWIRPAITVTAVAGDIDVYMVATSFQSFAD